MCARRVCCFINPTREATLGEWKRTNKKNDPRQRSRATLMFSQRNNPYCELLQKSKGKIKAFL